MGESTCKQKSLHPRGRFFQHDKRWDVLGNKRLFTGKRGTSGEHKKGGSPPGGREEKACWESNKKKRRKTPIREGKSN